VENLAWWLLSFVDPRVVEPSKNVTVPVGVLPPDVTVAVKLTVAAKLPLSADETSAVVVGIGFTAGFASSELLLVSGTKTCPESSIRDSMASTAKVTAARRRADFLIRVTRKTLVNGVIALDHINPACLSVLKNLRSLCCDLF
jgi:hypothetical protein